MRHDIGVAELLDSIGGLVWRARREELVRILDVDEAWRMNCVSDGERRRVQLCMGLVRPWKVLLLDEVCFFIIFIIFYPLLSLGICNRGRGEGGGWGLILCGGIAGGGDIGHGRFRCFSKI